MSNTQRCHTQTLCFDDTYKKRSGNAWGPRPQRQKTKLMLILKGAVGSFTCDLSPREKFSDWRRPSIGTNCKFIKPYVN